ncbi:MAG: YncE family protein [Nitrososphaerales archaeon]
MNKPQFAIVVIILLVVASASALYLGLGHYKTPSSTLTTPTTMTAGNNYTIRITDSMALPSVGERFDHMSIDIPAQLVFIAARGNNSVYVANLVTEGIERIITGLNEPQGVYYVQQYDKLYVSNGGDGTVDVFDASNYHLLKVLNFSGDADNIRYDSSSGLLYVGYGEENQSGIGIINAMSDKVVGNIPLNGHPEAFSLEQNGTSIFVNVPTANAIEVASKVNRTVIASWPLTNATENFPMALDEKNNRLFVGFGLPPILSVYDTNTGKVVSDINISSAADDIYFDPITKLVFVSCSTGYLDVIKQQDADSYRPLITLPTGPLARTSLFYPEQEELFVAVPQHDGLSALLLTFSIRNY